MAMITTETLHHPVSGMTDLIRSLVSAHSVRKQRAALKALDADRLLDLGISRTDALSEAKRPAWDVPSHWRR